MMLCEWATPNDRVLETRFGHDAVSFDRLTASFLFFRKVVQKA